MPLSFRPLALADGPALTRALRESSQKASDYTFVNLWAWQEDRRYEVAFADGLIWLRQTDPQERLWAPLGSWQRDDWEELLTKHFPHGASFHRVPEKDALILADRLGPQVSLDEERDQWEYLYLVEELVSLRGNRFHKKKNLLRQFLRSYDWRYAELEPKCRRALLDLQEEWCRWKNCDDSPGLAAEKEAITRILRDWEHFPGLLGGALFVDDVMVAYTLAEEVGDTVVIHFEKGLGDYKGVYQAINQIFLEKSAGRFTYVNREQDMGEEGLKKAKMSYNPVDFLKKHRVLWRP
ncbi:MAG: DUF2156 domain-containing protein [Synergistaceae bacterium]|jgi:hypothetical protein|nr:DUF2156 domain-containing protein [Synergistaceae bacterium]